MIIRDEVLETLLCHKLELAEQYGITARGIFGLIARNQTESAGDLDIVFCMDTPNLFKLVHVKEMPEETLHEHVDIVQYRERMNRFLKNRIDQEAIYV